MLPVTHNLPLSCLKTRVSLPLLPPRTYRQHRESFASCAPTVRKLNERLQLCSRALQRTAFSQPGAVYFTNLLLAWRYDELLNYSLVFSPSFSLSHLRPTRLLHTTQCALYFISFLCFLNNASPFARLLVLSQTISKKVEPDTKSDGRIKKSSLSLFLSISRSPSLPFLLVFTACTKTAPLK